jgi:hypothetical protein
MILGFTMAVGTVKPFATYILSKPNLFSVEVGYALQQGDLIETCALRICLLRAMSDTYLL